MTSIGATAVAAPGDGEDVLVVADGTGDNFGAGDLVHPTNDDFYDGAWDITQFRIGADGSRVYFDFEMAALENPFNLADGWSHEYFQVYIRDPNAGDGAPSAETGLASALNADFQRPYHYVLLAHGDGYQALLDADGGEVVSPDEAGLAVEGTTVSVSVPESALSDPSTIELSVLVTPYDGNRTNSGFLRAVESSAGDYAIGGGDDTTPKVLDTITPPDTAQRDVLSSAGGTPSLPLFSVPELAGEAEPTTTREPTTTEQAADPTTSAEPADPTTTEQVADPTTSAEPADSTTEQAADPTTTEEQDGGGMTVIPTTTEEPEPDTAASGDGGSTDDGDGPGFGIVSGLLGTAGGAAYAARRLLGAEAAESDD